MLNAIDSSAELNDKTHHIIFNCAAAAKEKNEDIRKFLQFVKSNEANSKLTMEIKRMVEVKTFEQSFINEYMSRRLFEQDFFSRGKDEGIEIGFEKGAQNNRVETAKKMIEIGLPLDTIITVSGLSKEELEPLLS